LIPISNEGDGVRITRKGEGEESASNKSPTNFEFREVGGEGDLEQSGQEGLRKKRKERGRKGKKQLGKKYDKGEESEEEKSEEDGWEGGGRDNWSKEINLIKMITSEVSDLSDEEELVEQRRSEPEQIIIGKKKMGRPKSNPETPKHPRTIVVPRYTRENGELRRIHVNMEEAGAVRDAGNTPKRSVHRVRIDIESLNKSRNNEENKTAKGKAKEQDAEDRGNSGRPAKEDENEKDM
jgi:hypothetical protein